MGPIDPILAQKKGGIVWYFFALDTITMTTFNFYKEQKMNARIHRNIRHMHVNKQFVLGLIGLTCPCLGP